MNACVSDEHEQHPWRSKTSVFDWLYSGYTVGPPQILLGQNPSLKTALLPAELRLARSEKKWDAGVSSTLDAGEITTAWSSWTDKYYINLKDFTSEMDIDM